VWRAYASNRDVGERRYASSRRVSTRWRSNREFTTTINVLQALANVAGA
jgi:hypothetical protein